ncbi:hypothetical protein BWQ96_10720 [Gracilariopsis chorda]|uniref:Uncharacterized protein n=1 Tax=Gracilariopsis chorda TaxID=448386 RepID=A0A2V3IBU5_9FLOR|nr:hypothetical protein BWQ96_10720 [Gracilariopsis chorda]|eukprot:PXF39582.1 hypothetical protein BWQ96_10720 [Gracilariopsis chorda]
MTALESFRAARRASLQADENDNQNVLRGENDKPASPTIQKGAADSGLADRPSECVTFPDRLDPIVPTGSAFTPHVGNVASVIDSMMPTSTLNMWND